MKYKKFKWMYLHQLDWSYHGFLIDKAKSGYSLFRIGLHGGVLMKQFSVGDILVFYMNEEGEEFSIMTEIVYKRRGKQSMLISFPGRVSAEDYKGSPVEKMYNTTYVYHLAIGKHMNSFVSY